MADLSLYNGRDKFLKLESSNVDWFDSTSDESDSDDLDNRVQNAVAERPLALPSIPEIDAEIERIARAPAAANVPLAPGIEPLPFPLDPQLMALLPDVPPFVPGLDPLQVNLPDLQIPLPSQQQLSNVHDAPLAPENYTPPNRG